MILKLRPVGSRVPLATKESFPLPWAGGYDTECFASGTDALAMAVELAALRKPSKNRPEVILPAYGCPDLVAAVVSRGAKPILVDVEERTPFYNQHLLESRITASTVAIVGVGFLGIPERLERLAELCAKNSLLLIEDAAQCFPPASASRPLADMVIVSFGRGKPINLMGGGMLLIRQNCLMAERKAIQQCSREAFGNGFSRAIKRVVFNLSLNRFFYGLLEKIPVLQIGKTKLRMHTSVIRKDIPMSVIRGGIRSYENRPRVYPLYESNFGELERLGWSFLSHEGDSGSDPEAPAHMLRFCALAPCRLVRDESVAALNAAGIGANAFYGEALHRIPGVRSKIDSSVFPAADSFAARVLTLPCHEDVTGKDVGKILSILERTTLKQAPAPVRRVETPHRI